jgi:hypothetical protein
MHKVDTWVSQKGLLKGSTIVSDAFCSKRCRKIFELYIELDFLEEHKQEILKKLEQLGAIKKKKKLITMAKNKKTEKTEKKGKSEKKQPAQKEKSKK